MEYKGYHFDIGGHRFFSKSLEVEKLWSEILPNDMLDRARSSRIFYNKKFFQYPLRPFEALWKLGIWKSTLCMLSYLKARIFPKKNTRTFKDWVTNQFGSRLFNIFFKTYTEKVWGMSCDEISADWAAQRIKGLSLATTIKNAFFSPAPRDRSKTIKTLINSFRYPKLGPGMMWEEAAKKIKNFGGEVRRGHKVIGTSALDDGRWRVTYKTSKGEEGFVEGDNVISSAPLRELVQALAPGTEIAKVAGNLRYRDFITVAVIVKDRKIFDDNWIYIHDPSVKVGRIQNFKSWSPHMVPDPTTNCYGLEYFCFEGDGLWTSPDSQLLELAKKELLNLGLIADPSEILDGTVVRQAKAYPVYDENYSLNVAKIREELEKKYPTLYVVGRNGMHKYNNQDHAMMTAMLTVENIIAGKRVFDVWNVNEDAEYHEEGSSGTSGLRDVPTAVVASSKP